MPGVRETEADFDHWHLNPFFIHFLIPAFFRGNLAGGSYGVSGSMSVTGFGFLLFLAVRKVAKEAALRCFPPVPIGFQGGAKNSLDSWNA